MRDKATGVEDVYRWPAVSRQKSKIEAKIIVTKQNNQTSPGAIVNINSPLFLVLADRSDLPLWSMVLCIALYCLGSSISFWKGTLS